ncbi:hypothetical protein LC593_28925 [Nostoc sp. CHAB 5844]|nr:hypothetical protein [Nostoc sp. CHAB 5844]
MNDRLNWCFDSGDVYDKPLCVYALTLLNFRIQLKAVGSPPVHTASTKVQCEHHQSLNLDSIQGLRNLDVFQSPGEETLRKIEEVLGVDLGVQFDD